MRFAAATTPLVAALAGGITALLVQTSAAPVPVAPQPVGLAPVAVSEPEDSSDDGDRIPATATATTSTSRFVSLTAHTRQRVKPNTYTLLRFDGEPSDAADWHKNGSALIVPDRTGVANVCFKVTWVDDARPKQYYVQIARDPLGAIDVTGAQDSANTAGRDYRAGCWVMTVRKNQPLAIRVKHDGPAVTSVHFAEFKVWLP